MENDNTVLPFITDEEDVDKEFNNNKLLDFDIDMAINMAKDYKQAWLLEIQNEIVEEIYKHADMGITQFVTKEYPKLKCAEDINQLSKLHDGEIKQIVRNFEEKGVQIKARIDPQKDSVKFLIKIY